MEDANFANLDAVLSRVKRRTLRETEEDEQFFGLSQPRRDEIDAPEGEEEEYVEFPDIIDHTEPRLKDTWDGGE